MPAQLTYLKINQFRHVRPGSVIEFKRQLNVVVGRNGTGKTTLLNLVSALLRHNVSEFVRDSFSIEFQMVDEGNLVLVGTLTNVYENQESSLSFNGRLTVRGRAVEIESTEAESWIVWDDQRRKAVSIVPTKTATDHSMGFMTEARGAASDAGAIAEPAVDWTDVAQLQTLTRLTEGVETFAELFGGYRPANLGFEVLHGSSRRLLTLGIGLSPTILPPDPELDERDSIVLDRGIPPLECFVRLTQYLDAKLILVKTSTGADVTTFGSPVARFRTARGTQIPHDQLAFGEKRLLAFLLKLFAYTPSIIIDELANGMHHDWIEQCVELLDDLRTQAFLTSQNPLLLDCLPLDRDTYSSSHTLVICELAESGEMVWRNLSEAETEDFFRSLDVGLQHISEIMRTKGLW